MERYTYLAHYGIPKQQWGVRRFQNPDGSLTPEGRRRYGVGDASLKATDKANRYKAKADSYRYKASVARAKYNPDKAARLELKANRYEAKSSRSNAQASKLALRDSRIANSKFKESDIYAMEGAKRAGLLGAAVGKAVGVYKERKETKQKERSERFEKENSQLESESMYDVSINNRRKPLAQRVKDTEDQLQKICDAHVKRLSAVMETIPGQNPFDDVDSLYDGSFAQQLAYRINERFDVDGTLDQRMDEWVHDYREGLMSRKEFKQHYEAELNDYSAWAIDTYKLDDLKKVANTFTDAAKYEGGEQVDTSPKTGWKDYLKRVDSWEGVDSNSLNRQNSKKSSQQGSKSWVEEAANDPEHWELIDDTPGERIYARRDSSKSSGRYKTGSKSGADTYKPNKDNWKEVSEGVYEPTEKLSKQPKGKYISVIAKNGSRSMVRIEDKASAAVTLGFMGLSQSEIASKLGISEEQLKKELASYKPRAYNGGIGVGRISKK